MAGKRIPGLSIEEKPGGRLHKLLVDYDGAVVLDESILPHDELISFIHRPMDEYRKKLAELEQHPLFRESLDVSVLDFNNLLERCFELAYSFENTYPEAHFFMRIALEDLITEKDDGSAAFLLHTGMKALQAVRQLYTARIQMRNMMEVCFGMTDGLSQAEHWENISAVYPLLREYTFGVRWERNDGAWVQRYSLWSLVDMYIFELCAALRSEKRIARCKCCWQYFVPKTNKRTDYCDRVLPNGQSCKKYGANLKRRDGPAEDTYLLAFKILRARFYERFEKCYRGEIPYSSYYDWAEEAGAARMAYLSGELGGEEFLRRINPHGEVLDLSMAKRPEDVGIPVWEKLVKVDMSFDPARRFEDMQSLDLGEKAPNWGIVTAQEQMRRARGRDIGLLEKYGKQERDEQ